MKKTISLQLELIRDKKERVLKSRHEIAEKVGKLQNHLNSLDETYRKLEKEEKKLLLSTKNKEASEEKQTSEGFSEASAKMSNS